MQRDDDEFFIAMMTPIIEPFMTSELAQQEAIADHHTEHPDITWQEFAGNFN